MSQYSATSAQCAEPAFKARILVVDDDDIVRGLHEAVLSLAGYATDSATDGDEALVAIGLARFDLVLTDCNMPNRDGLSLVRALRAAGNRIPIMMVSASLMERALPPDIRSEVAVALPKPARMDELITGVSLALRSRTMAPEKERISTIFPKSNP